MYRRGWDKSGPMRCSRALSPPFHPPFVLVSSEVVVARRTTSSPPVWPLPSFSRCSVPDTPRGMNRRGIFINIYTHVHAIIPRVRVSFHPFSSRRRFRGMYHLVASSFDVPAASCRRKEKQRERERERLAHTGRPT